MERVIQFPHSCLLLEGDFRQSLFAHFPYATIYTFEDEQVMVVSVFCLHRKPYLWSENVEQDPIP